LASESRLREGYKNKLGETTKQEDENLNQESSDDDQGSVEGEVLATNEGAGNIIDDRFD
jgi:hypothetical protein